MIGIALAAMVAVWAQESGGADPGPVWGLDHIPIAVRDLEAAGAQFRRLGFTLKPGRVHPNGLRNLHAKFADGSELELITADSATDGVTRQYLAHLSRGDGPAFLALYSPEVGLVERRLDGWTAGRLAGTYRRQGEFLYITTGPLDYVFFGPRNASPSDRPEHLQHANGAQALVAVWLAGDDLSAERAMLEAIGAKFGETESPFPGEDKVPVARLPEGEVLFLPGSRQFVPGRKIVGATVRVRDLRPVSSALGSGVEWRSVVVKAAGMWVELGSEGRTAGRHDGR